MSYHSTECPTPHGHGEIQLFQKFQKFAERKTEKFWQIVKIFFDRSSKSNAVFGN